MRQILIKIIENTCHGTIGLQPRNADTFPISLSAFHNFHRCICFLYV